MMDKRPMWLCVLMSALLGLAVVFMLVALARDAAERFGWWRAPAAAVEDFYPPAEE